VGGVREEAQSAGEVGFVGVVVQLAGLLPLGLLAPVGFLVELAALRRLSKAFNSRTIWNNAWKAVFFAVSAVASAVVFVATSFGFLLGRLPFPVDVRSPLHLLFLFLAVFLAWVSIYEFVLFAGKHYESAYCELAKLSGVAEFEAAARWTSRGASLFVVFVGIALLLVGRVHALLGYGSLRSGLGVAHAIEAFTGVQISGSLRSGLGDWEPPQRWGLHRGETSRSRRGVENRKDLSGRLKVGSRNSSRLGA